MVDMTECGFDQILVAPAQEERDAVHAHDPARCGDPASQIVGDVPLVIMQDPGIRMRHDDGSARGLDRVRRRAISGMAAIDEHADAVHLRDERAAEAAQPGIFRLVAAVVNAALADLFAAVTAGKWMSHRLPVEAT